MKKILIPSLVAVEFIGDGQRVFRGKPHKNRWLEVSIGDILVLDEFTVINFCRGKEWRIMEGIDFDLSPLYLPKISRLDDLPIEEVKVLIEEKNVLTKTTIHLFSTEELITFGKQKKVTGLSMKSSREKVIPLILRYLDD